MDQVCLGFIFDATIFTEQKEKQQQQALKNNIKQ